MALRALLSATLALVMCNCTVMTGNGTGYTYASFAGNAKGLTVTPTGASAAEVDNSTGAALAKEMAKDIAKAYAWGRAFDAAGKLIEEGFDAAKDANDTDAAINASDNATKVEVETFVPPAPITE